MAALGATLGAAFGGDEGRQKTKGFMSTLIDVIRGRKRDPKEEQRETRRAAIEALRRIGVK